MLVALAGGVLPGSSPPVPSSPAALKGEGYTPGVLELRTPVWTCTKLRLDPPMHFLLQWQSTKPGSEGVAIAWIDADGDGAIDRALAFHATLKTRGLAEMGPIEPIDKATPVLPIRDRPAGPSPDSVY